MDEVLLKTYGSQLAKAAIKAYGIDLKDVDWKSDSGKTALNILNNTWQFSGAKTYTQLKDIGAALLNPDGSFKSEKDFIIAAQNISKTQLNWLKTERNTAIGGAQMIALWDKITAQKDIFPFLQFDAVIDSATTALCDSLHKVVRRVDDWFWEYYYPLNHFGCRSTVRQLRNGKETPEAEIKLPEIPVMFKTNLGKTGIVFPVDHPYFTGTPAEIMNESKKVMPYEMQFDILDESDKLGGIIRSHFQLQKQNDYQRLLKIAIDKASKKGTIVDLMPIVNPAVDNVNQRNIIFADAKAGKSPDLRINGVLVEEEASTNSRNINNIKHAIGAGAKQADHVIISLSEEISIETMKRISIGRFKDHKNLMVIEFYHNKIYTVFKRPIKS